VPEFNREMLFLARESRGLTQTELAAAVGISQAEISKFENGIKIPSDLQVKSISEVLRYLVPFFFLEESVRSFGSGCVYHRKRKSATDTKLTQLLAMINVKRIQIRHLLKSVESKAPYTFEALDLDEFQGGPPEVARALRALWQLPPGPIHNLVRAIEDAGGIVIRCDFGTSKVDALSQWLPGACPIFLVNDSIPTDRLRFTLAHEIGHIVMHRMPTVDMEREADKFAAELLMPENDIRAHLSHVDIPKLAAMKQYWRVAMGALLYRAADLKTIDERRKSYLWFRMGQAGYRTHEPVEIPPEEPTLLNELLEVHRDSMGYGQAQIDSVVFEPKAFIDMQKKGTTRGLRLISR
jgi:Zn-dependent peptidase ImmA (M78 family)/transcriptional regulator with XRE-family HTH domain